MQNCQGCRWESSGVPGGLGGRARRLLTLRVLDERQGAARGALGSQLDETETAAAGRGREQEGWELKEEFGAAT